MPMDTSTVFPFDPASGDLPDDLPLPPEKGGEVLALVADAATRESGWAPRAAVALARAWAGRGRSVILMDGDSADPALHQVLGRDNGEGVTDAVLYGVSTSRMTQPEEGGLRFAPAGTVVAEPSAVLRHPRWSSVLAACRGSESVAVLYLPGGVPGTESLASQADRVVRLSTAPGAAEARAQGVTVLHPVRAREKATLAATSGAGESPSEDFGSGEPTRAASAPASRAEADAVEEKKSSDPLGARPVRRRLSVWALLFLLVLVGGLLAALWLVGYLEFPGQTGAAALIQERLAGSP